MLTVADLALAYELRVAGWSWKAIGRELGIDHASVGAAVRYRLIHGLNRGRTKNPAEAGLDDRATIRQSGRESPGCR